MPKFFSMVDEAWFPCNSNRKLNVPNILNGTTNNSVKLSRIESLNRIQDAGSDQEDFVRISSNNFFYDPLSYILKLDNRLKNRFCSAQ